jgi:uncharacterized protein (DUF1330 family)|tara:strand:+ start:911 stop:1195 length:285 start_codon:yes stop_codon:yes gene_type:complete
MKGYWIVKANTINAKKQGKYAKLATAAVEKYGGKYIVRGGQSITKEGVEFERNIVIEFDSYQLAQEAYTSEEYNHAKLVLGSDKDRILSIVEGT